MHYSVKGPDFVASAIKSGCHPVDSYRGWRRQLEFCPEDFCSKTSIVCSLNTEVFIAFWKILDTINTEIVTGVITTSTLLDIASLIRLNKEEHDKRHKTDTEPESDDNGVVPVVETDRGRTMLTFKPRPLMHYMKLQSNDKPFGQPWRKLTLFSFLFQKILI